MLAIASSARKVSDLFHELDVVPETGLAPQEAARRLVRQGRNVIEARTTTWFDILVRQVRSPFIYLLTGAGALALALGERTDAVFIVLFIVLNTGLSFYQEYRSEGTLRLLQQYVRTSARVLRGGAEQVVDSAELVRGDIVIVGTGDEIPADVRFFYAHNLAVDESALTGESAPVQKTNDVQALPPKGTYDAINIGFSGTFVVEGKGKGVVVASGKASKIGEIATLASETKRVSGFEKSIDRFSAFVLRLILVTTAFMFAANLFIKGAKADVASLFIFSIALAVSVIPEGLPVVVTFSLSRGARRLAKHKVVVKRLSAIEDLGSVEILCSDKTGTLTENVLTVADTLSLSGKDPLWYASVASPQIRDAKKAPNNAFDLALWIRLDHHLRTKLSEFRIVHEIPFDPARRRNSVVVARKSASMLLVRGAPEEVMSCSIGMAAAQKRRVRDWVADQGRKGRRVIAVGWRKYQASRYDVADECASLEFVGLVSFVDPVKSSTKQAVKNAEQLGVKVKILTGDDPYVAGAVAYEVGLIASPKNVITGEELAAMGDEAMHGAVEKYAVFARVSPDQKYRIIKLLQERHLVGFLGEGINDAPALKIANVALVVQGAADISRDAADIVLLRSSLKVIIDGIHEGRQVFANTIKYIKATLSGNFGNFYSIAIASFLIPFLPMLSVQVLLVNLMTDFPLIAVAMDSVDRDELRRPGLYNIRGIALLATILGLVSTAFDFVFFALFSPLGPQTLQTNWFIGSVLTEIVFVYCIRTRKRFFEAKRPSIVLLVFSVVVVAVALILPYTTLGARVFHFTPPPIEQLVLIISIVGVFFFVAEQVKLLYYRFSAATTSPRGK